VVAARCAIALVAALSWFAISNHCVLAVALTSDQPAQSKCPFHSHSSKPAKQKDSEAQPCCKILRAVPSAGAKSCVPAVVHLADVDLRFAQLIVFARPTICFGSVVSDTGPPGKTLFAELIGSIRPHAPPSLG
jgi:hypothetical protein